jgi:hypothetical protein
MTKLPSVRQQKERDCFGVWTGQQDLSILCSRVEDSTRICFGSLRRSVIRTSKSSRKVDKHSRISRERLRQIEYRWNCKKFGMMMSLGASTVPRPSNFGVLGLIVIPECVKLVLCVGNSDIRRPFQKRHVAPIAITSSTFGRHVSRM